MMMLICVLQWLACLIFKGALCALCELLVQSIDKYIKQNKSEAAINQTVYKICNSLPDPIKGAVSALECCITSERCPTTSVQNLGQSKMG